MVQLAPGAVVLVTGATGAIGRAIAAQAAAGGATVGVHGSRDATVAGAMEALRDACPAARLVAAPGDFSRPGGAARVVEAVVAEAGRLDAVIHCAVTGARGGRITGAFRDTDPERYAEHAGQVLGIYQQLCFAALPHLARRGGAIVGFASDAGRFAAPRQSLVGAAFGGIMAFTRNLAVEAARDGVRVHCISPSFVADTPVHRAALERSGRAEAAARRAGLGLPTPSDIAPMALFLCSPQAAKITGQVISINGGLNA